MDETPRTLDTAASAFWTWLGFWVRILVLGVLAVIGAFAASGAEQPGDYGCGMTLSLTAIALAFLKLKHHLDGGRCSFVDFLLPTTEDIPRVEVAHLETPSPLTPLGMKGLGEAGAIPGPALLASAIDDALRPLGVRIARMPLGPADLLALIEATGERPGARH